MALKSWPLSSTVGGTGLVLLVLQGLLLGAFHQHLEVVGGAAMFIHASEDLLLPVDTFEEIAICINKFFQLLVELLRMRSDVLYAPRLYVLLYLVPIFAVNAQGFQEEVMLLGRPATYVEFSLCLY